ncbi:DUF1819 family protein [Brachybacterium alimentarium]|uniref:DUF1819 family protein n=1 Tax=Brachybacterium alimentarium TaxID=47845 RepID=UPI0021621F53|nr:DUF1819 family protein [Brachybacterium alimentarium]
MTDGALVLDEVKEPFHSFGCRERLDQVGASTVGEPTYPDQDADSREECNVNSDSAVAPRYALSFTTGGLLERESAVLAPVYIEHRDWAKVRDIAVEENLLQTRTHSTGVRRVRETVKRMSALFDHEIEIFSDITATERGHLMWVAACRRYELIGEFAEEVLRERFLTLAGTVAYEDYDSFYRAKAMWHDELGAVSDLSYKKLRQVLFKMVVEAGLLTAKGAIEPVLPTAHVADCLNQRTPSDIRFFPTRVV